MKLKVFSHLSSEDVEYMLRKDRKTFLDLMWASHQFQVVTYTECGGQLVLIIISEVELTFTFWSISGRGEIWGVTDEFEAAFV